MMPKEGQKRGGGFYNRSLERALQILCSFSNERRTLSLAQITQAVNLSRATAFRLCVTLTEQGFLKQDEESKQYSLGLKLFELGSLVFHSFSLRETSAPYLTQLQKKTGKTVFLGILDNDELVYIDKREDPSTAISFTSKIGTRRPPYWGMCGPVLMADLPEGEIDRLLRVKPLQAITRKSITDKREFKKWLAQIEAQGYAVDAECTFDGITGIASPIRDFTGRVAGSVGIATISSSLKPRELERLIGDLTKTAQVISKEMGYNRSGV